uniref:sushi, von Willebrand factor type A, EGF and pentraxin domain-containing protein 1-like isoform X2 n=1 Tax=Podarcis muralis TaxID=64176 RepID=UPI00109F8E26|nr:sushi, von Willebrand factor type A, EGF and pentraxin domain-containing protein 1-like isoform X2 [Podarcis muralis]
MNNFGHTVGEMDIYFRGVLKSQVLTRPSCQPARQNPGASAATLAPINFGSFLRAPRNLVSLHPCLILHYLGGANTHSQKLSSDQLTIASPPENAGENLSPQNIGVVKRRGLHPPRIMSSLLFLALLAVLWFSQGSGQVGVRNLTDPKCPLRKKNFTMLTGQTCQKNCERRRCSKSRKCECDGECGMSCISTDARNPPSHCKSPPEIENGSHEGGPYNTGREVHYWCDYGYRLEGPSSLLCQENEEWSHAAPTCHPVTCSRPPNIAEATLVAVHQSEYPVGTVIYYLCNKDFLLDGSNRVVCLENGNWSQLPYCRARCPITAKRSRMIYQGRKLWVYEIPDGLVHHGEIVTFFCRSENKTCSFTADSQCFDGVLKMPDCYDEPTYLQYHLFPKRVVSEIPAC